MMHKPHPLLLPLLLAGAPLPTGAEGLVSPLLPPAPEQSHLLVSNADPELINNCRALVTDTALADHEKISLLLNITTALKLGSDPQAEDPAGNSAMLYLSASPDTLALLKESGLLENLREQQPIPESLQGLTRLLNTRAKQLQEPLPTESKAYLQRYSITPVTQAAEALLDKLIHAPVASNLSPEALSACLRFLRAQDEPKILKFIADLPFWEHGEHFIEASPGQLLRVLHELHWPVPSDKIKAAIKKLDSMLPTSREDLIDCNAAYPLALLLEMLVQQEDAQAWEIISPYMDSPDPEMACAALVLDLQRQGLPAPDECELISYLGTVSGDGAIQLSELIQACRINNLLLQEQTHLLNIELLQRGVIVLTKIGANAHAAIIQKYLNNIGQEGLEPILSPLCQEYKYLNTESTRLQAARFILAHPQLFQAPQP